MGIIAKMLPYTQIVLAVALIALILLQKSDADLGGAFGGTDTLSAPAHTRRGFERFTFVTTIVISVLFVAASLCALVVR